MTDHHRQDAEVDALLQRFGHDAHTFEQLRKSLGQRDRNALRGVVSPPETNDVTELPSLGSAARNELQALGERALRAGQVGVVILAGGMATRFGGVVKAGVTAVLGKTFLELKLADIRHLVERLQTNIPVYVMTSFATHDDVERMTRQFETPRTPIRCFSQFVALRCDASGEPFRDTQGKLSPYAPGHGDLSFALRKSGCLSNFREQGGTLLAMSNVDNLGATLDPAVLGAHIASGKAITAEVVQKEPGDKGGAPARVDGTPQIVESFRFPESFDQDSIPVFNTNTFILDADALERDFPLTYFVVKKKVDGREAIQFERLVGELTAFLPTGFLQVERSGPDGRFLPVKDPDELAARSADIEAVLRTRGVV